MSKRQLGFIAGVALVSIGVLAQTPPPNDNFSNATVLAGTSITFTGTFAGSEGKQRPTDQTGQTIPSAAEGGRPTCGAAS